MKYVLTALLAMSPFFASAADQPELLKGLNAESVKLISENDKRSVRGERVATYTTTWVWEKRCGLHSCEWNYHPYRRYDGGYRLVSVPGTNYMRSYK